MIYIFLIVAFGEEEYINMVLSLPGSVTFNLLF
jgi:hypothetical protein